MKSFLVWVCVLFLPVLACAQEAAPRPLVPSNVQIIDGKKFFSLGTARRMQPTGNTPSPSALSVLNHPRTDFRVSPSERLAMTPVARPQASTALPWAKGNASPSAPAASPQTGLSKSDQVKQELLSIFAPDDRAVTSPPVAR